MSFRESRRTVGYSVSEDEFARLERIARARGLSPGQFAQQATRRALQDAAHSDQLMATLEPAHGTA